MSWNQTKVKQVKSRLLAGKIMELLGKENVLYNWLGSRVCVLDGKQVRIEEFDPLSLEEQAELEDKILEQVKLMA